jgi:hypothetical protein
MRLRLRFCRKRRTWLGSDWGSERNPVPVTRLPDGMLSFAGRVDPVELIVHALNESGATGIGRVPHQHPYSED